MQLTLEETRNLYGTLVKKPLGKLWRRYDQMKSDLRVIGCENGRWHWWNYRVLLLKICMVKRLHFKTDLQNGCVCDRPSGWDKSFCGFSTDTSFYIYEIIVRSVLLAMDHLLSSSRDARREASLYIISDQPTERHSFFDVF